MLKEILAAQRHVGFLVEKNLPTILSVGATVCSLKAVEESGKATIKAKEIIKEEAERRVEEAEEKSKELTKKNKKKTIVEPQPINTFDKVKLTWKTYSKTVLYECAAIGCIYEANHINIKRLTATAAAYSISSKELGDYKDKVAETIGIKKEEDIRSSVEKDKATKNPPVEETIIRTDHGESLFKDSWTGRYFYSDMQAVKKVVNDLNYSISSGMDAAISMNDLYYGLGLDAADGGECWGWHVGQGLIEPEYTAIMTDKDIPCICINFRPYLTYDTEHEY